MSLTLSTDLTLLGVCLSLFVGLAWVIPTLSTRTAKYYFLFLLMWAAPYTVAQFADTNKWGPLWVRYHLLDTCYAQWSTTLGVATYVLVMRLQRRRHSHHSVMTWTGISLIGFMMYGYAYENCETVINWWRSGSLAQAIDWGDYTSLSVGALITALPLMLFTPRFAVMTRAS